jgi:type I restriction enzyme S subunit
MSETLERVVKIDRHRFSRYPAYEDSGVEWLGEIPAHWQVRRLKYLAALNPESLSEDTDPMQEMVYVDIGGVDSLGRLVEPEPLTFASAPSRARRLVRHGDVIVSTVRTYLRAIARISDPAPGLVVSTGFAVVRPDNGLTTDYAAYALRAPYFVERVVANSTGVSFPAINESEMATYELAVPPEPEQRAIAAFLDRQTARIDALVAKKERLVELLEEKRAALITRAVTRGLDPNIPMKDSGIEWLGAIPAHWDVKPLKGISGLQTGLTLGKTYEKASLVARPYLRVANVQDGYLALDDIAEVELPVQDAPRYELHAGDVLMTEGGDFDKLGRGYVWEAQIAGCLHQNHIFAVRPRRDVLSSRFLALTMSSGYGRAYFTATSKQSTNLASTNSTKLRNLPMPLPKFSEQKEIVLIIDRETARIDALVARVRDAIDRLKELRTALISAAVTGKIDVREDAGLAATAPRGE